MKKITLMVTVLAISLPVLAINEPENLTKQQIKYQMKLEKIQQKQALDRAKHPERYSSPVAQQNFTLGLVQSSIKAGISQADVISVLGSPNIVTKDSNGKDTWIYDKVATVSSSTDTATTGSIGGLGGGFGAHGFGGGFVGASRGVANSNAQSNQKTLTVVIKFTADNKVESYTYHMSNF